MEKWPSWVVYGIVVLCYFALVSGLAYFVASAVRWAWL